MRRVIHLAALCIALTTGTAYAQTPGYCSIALTEKAYDRVDSQVKQNIAFAARDDLCSRDYNNVGEAQSAARSRGFSLGYSGVEIGASEAKQSSNGKWSIAETNFCKATSTDLQTSYQQDYESQVASIAVNAWLECVRSSNQNSLFMDYEVSEDGQYYTGTLYTTASTGALNRQIIGISVVGTAADTVSCNIGGRKYNVNDPISSPIEVTTTGTAVACAKTGDEGVSIALQTSQGSLPFVKLPSKIALAVGDYEQLRSEMRATTAKIEEQRSVSAEGISSVRAALNIAQNALNSKISAANGEISATRDRFSKIRFEKVCVSRDHNNCDPWKALPACPSGFRYTGLTEDNFWSGGRCGIGSVCSVCYTDR